jgi:hypothetical protein
MRFQVLTEASMKMVVFWVVAPCCLVEVYRRFRGACCFHHQGVPKLHFALFCIFIWRRNDRRCDASRWAATVVLHLVPRLVFALFGLLWQRRDDMGQVRFLG